MGNVRLTATAYQPGGVPAMIMRLDGGRWYIDVRGVGTSDEHSLDLAQHLPRRLSAGPIIVVHHKPKVFLSVIRKRWIRLLREIEIQRSSTLNRAKRAALQFEINQMRSCQFSAKPVAQAPSGTQVFFIKPDELAKPLPEYATLYIATPLASSAVLQALHSLMPSGLIVIYGEWTADYEVILQQAYPS